MSISLVLALIALVVALINAANGRASTVDRRRTSGVGDDYPWDGYSALVVDAWAARRRVTA